MELNNIFTWCAIAFSAVWLLGECSTRADDQTQLNLARCLVAEVDSYSGSNNSEWAAHAWVLRKISVKKGVSLNDIILSYCAVFKRKSRIDYGSRASNIRRSSFQNPLHGTAGTWRRLEAFTGKFLAGQVKDPCPTAMHFGRESDVGDKPLVEVCKWLGKRGNKFFRVKK